MCSVIREQPNYVGADGSGKGYQAQKGRYPWRFSLSGLLRPRSNGG